MKICLVSPHYPSDDAIGEYCSRIASSLCKKARVVVLANKVLNSLNVESIRQTNNSVHYTVNRIWQPDFLYPFKIIRGIIQERPDIIHIQHEYFLYGNGYKAVLFPILLVLAKTTGIPIVVTMHHVIPKKEIDHFRDLLGTSIPKVLISGFLSIFNKLFSLADKIIVPSDTLKLTLTNDYGIRNDQIRVVQHFIYKENDDKPERDSKKAKSSLNLDKKKVVLFFGYIRPTKGIEYVLRGLPLVIEKVPNVMLSIVGKAQPNYLYYLRHLEQIVQELSLSEYVRFENHVSEELLPAFFNASDAVIFPYTSTIGMTPIAHLKAASYGKPMIVTSIDTFKDLSDHENALIVPPRDVIALAIGTIELLTNEGVASTLSTHISQYCLLRSQDRAVGKIIEIYQDILNKRKLP